MIIVYYQDEKMSRGKRRRCQARVARSGSPGTEAFPRHGTVIAETGRGQGGRTGRLRCDSAELYFVKVGRLFFPLHTPVRKRSVLCLTLHGWGNANPHWGVKDRESFHSPPSPERARLSPGKRRSEFWEDTLFPEPSWSSQVWFKQSMPLVHLIWCNLPK